MPLQQTSGNVTQDAYAGGKAAVPVYVESVFSTYLYSGTGATQSITNNIDLTDNGGMTWIKCRTNVYYNLLFDTVRGSGYRLVSNNTTASTYNSDTLTSFNTNGFTVGADSGGIGTNVSGQTFASWTFRKQPKFFDVVTYTGNGAGSNLISHNLGVQPSCIIFKVTSAAGYSWTTVHRGTNGYLNLNLTDAAAATYAAGIGNIGSGALVPCSATQIDVGPLVNDNGKTFVAYLFAHNAGGFGLTGTDNVISCGSYTGTGASNNFISLGWEPQYLLIKRTDSTSSWNILDTMRGLGVGANWAQLNAETSGAEYDLATNGYLYPTATGFNILSNTGAFNASGGTYIYIAIRRGPMAVPTDPTKVFSPSALNAPTNGTQITTGFPVDMSIWKDRSGTGYYGQLQDRLRGLPPNSTTTSPVLYPDNINAEDTAQTGYNYWNTGFLTLSGENNVWWNFGRAPNFFDVVCYTGTGSATTVKHNLGVAPELIIVKKRNVPSTTGWLVGATTIGYANKLYLNLTNASSADSTAWNSTAPTSTVFSVGTNTDSNASGSIFVAYLFATCPGVSKVGSYTGTGATQTISCGFTGGARFVFIKRTDSIGDWWVWDTARGMVSGTDPRLALDTISAETNANWVYTTTGGFQIVTTDASVNASGGSYIFLAIA